MKPTTTPTQKETYARTHDDPFFYGMRRGEAALARKGRIFDFKEKLLTKNINRSASDIGDRGSRHFSDSVAEDVTYSPKVSPSDIVLEPVGRSLSGRWPKTCSPLAASRSDLNIYLHEADELPTVSCLNASETSEESVNQIGMARSVMQRSYDVRMRQKDISNVPFFFPSAALYYYGPSPLMEVVGSCESMHKLNLYLKARRSDVNAGVPGRFLHAVLGLDFADVGSVASTIRYAFYLDQNHKRNQFCTLPIINMKTTDLESCADLQWLLNSCHIDLSSLIFIDEIPWANARNSASALLRATIGCFLLRHITRFPHTNVQYPDVERLSVGDSTRSASLYTLILQSVVFLKRIPFPEDPFRYLNTIYSIHMFLDWVIHALTDDTHYKSNVWSCMCQIY